MKCLLFTIILSLFFGTIILAQDAEKGYKKIETGTWMDLSYKLVDESGNDMSFMSLEEMPEYPDGFDALAKFITDTLKYPQSAIDDNVSGRVFTQFTVDPNGKVKDVKTLRGVRVDLDSACVWAISIMPDWSRPGKLKGKAVSVSFVLRVRFILKD